MAQVVTQGKWLNNAIHLDIIHHKRSNIVSNLVNNIYTHIKPLLSDNHNIDKYKSAVRLFLLNSWVAFLFNTPIRISRDEHSYTAGKRYKALYFSYSIIKSVHNAFIEHKYIKHFPGFFSPNSKKNRQTRFYPSKKLISLFKTFGWDISNIQQRKTPPPEIIQFKEKKGNKKVLKKYEEKRKITRMRNTLIKINKFNETLDCTVKLDRYSKVNKRFLFQKLVNGIFKTGIFELKKVETSFGGQTFGKSFDAYLINEYRKLMALNKNKRDVEYKKEFYLGDIGIDILEFKLAYNTWHRVFNDKLFKKTGRFYGGSHLELPKEIRKNNLFLGGIPTVSLDFQAMHSRMCYHMEGIDYKGDIYNISGIERKHIKLAMLIIFNAKNEQQGLRAILNEFISRNFDQQYLNFQYIKHLMNTFKTVHSPIKKYVYSDISNELQFKDAYLMNEILKKLILKNKIMTLPVHDEIIISKNDKQIAKQIMIDEYYKIFKFKPIIT